MLYEPAIGAGPPYPGLRPFGPDERDIFFGRDDQITDLVSKLLDRHFLIVTGASGCGKSSLVRTGLLNSLQAHDTAPGERNWNFIEFRPGTAPLWELADGLRRAVHERLDGARRLDPGWAQQQLDLRANLLRDGYPGLRQALVDGVYGSGPLLAGGRQVLLLADQFEEIFRYGQRLDDDLRARAFMEEAAALVRILLGPVGVLRNYEAGQGRAPDAVDEAIHVVVTMRTEYLDRCGEFDCLLAAINDSFAIAANLEGVNLTRAIVGPAGRRGGAISSKLVNRLMGHAERITFDRLPLLQHVLMRCWRLAGDREGSLRMTLEDYHDTRPLTKGEALSKHADEAFADVEAVGEGRLAEIMFRELTDRPPGVGYDSARDTRRLRSVAEIAAVAGLEGEQWQRLEPVVERFARPDTNFVLVKKAPLHDGATRNGENDQQSLSPETVLDISHEALIRNWHRLHRWVDAEFDDGNRLRQYVDAAARYGRNKAKGDDTPNLARGELAKARQWWFDQDHPHRRRPAWAQRYGCCPEDLAQVQSYLDEAYAYYQCKDDAEKSKAFRRKLRKGGLMFTALTLFVTTPLVLWVRSEMRNEYVEDFRRDILIAHQTLQTLRRPEMGPIETIFEDWEPGSFRSLLAKPIIGFDDYAVIQSTVAEVKEMANDIIANTKEAAALAAEGKWSGQPTAFVRTLPAVPTALSWNANELRVAFADNAGAYLWDVDSHRLAFLANHGGTNSVAGGLGFARVCPEANLSGVREIVPVHGSAEWLMILDEAVVRATVTKPCTVLPLPATSGDWRRLIAWEDNVAVLEPLRMHRWQNEAWHIEALQFDVEPERGETVAALARASDGALHAISSRVRRLHGRGTHLATSWDMGLPEQMRVRKVAFGSHPRGHLMVWLDDAQAGPRLLLLEGTTLVPIDEIEAFELIRWLSSDQAARQPLKLATAPADGKQRELEEAAVPRLVDFDYRCFGDRGCWLAAAVTGGSSAPPLLLAKRLHGTHEH